MSSIKFNVTTDLTNKPNPTGYEIAYDLDGVLKQKDSAGVIKPLSAIHLLGKLIGADMNNVGVVHSINATPSNGGTGYAHDDILTITDGDNTATLRVSGESGGVVTSLILLTGGHLYTVGPDKATSGGTGNGDCTIEILSLMDDMPISLTGGTKFAITDVLITNASTSLTSATNLEFYDDTLRNGNLQASVKDIGSGLVHVNADPLTFLVTPDNYINNGLTTDKHSLVQVNQSNISCGNTLYASLIDPQGSTASADIYVYGYILA